jgi:glutathione synthase/RimK-type ligase-like ATP-grasp enzyme
MLKTKGFSTQIRTKNFTSAPLRGEIGRFPVRSIVRLGSRTPNSKAFPKALSGAKIIEINTVQSVENSRSKLLMKACFKAADVPQSRWFTYAQVANGSSFHEQGANMDVVTIENLPYPMLAKRICGFKGHGMAKLDDVAQMREWLRNNSVVGYYFEQFMNYAREYRLHCTQDKCFMVWRKLRKADADNRWFFNSSNCNWVGENHNLFDRPSNFDAIVVDCIKAIKAVGLEVGSFDVRIQSSTQRNPAYILVEVNSAPSLGEQGVEIYKEVIKDLITKKI